MNIYPTWKTVQGKLRNGYWGVDSQGKLLPGPWYVTGEYYAENNGLGVKVVTSYGSCCALSLK